MNGFFFINKQEDVTSFATVTRLKNKFDVKKIGHTGTLDKFASGLLLVFTGKYTKLVDVFLKLNKTYVAEIEFGYMTDTLDRNGSVIKTTDNLPTISDIRSVMGEFSGNITQIPPNYSRISVDGQRAQKKAQAGEEFELAPRNVNIRNIYINQFDGKKLTLTVDCSSGTYVRSIARDMGYATDGFATLVNLRRTFIENISVYESKIIDNIQIEDAKDILQYISRDRLIYIEEEQKYNMEHGKEIKDIMLPDGIDYVGIFEGQPVAVLKQHGEAIRYNLLT